MEFSERIKLTYDRLVDVPSSDPDDARRRKLLNIILVGMLFVAGGVLLATLILMLTSALKSNDAAFLVVASFATMGGVIVFYLINRLWSGALASISFLVFLMFVITLADSPSELSNGRSIFLFAIPIIVASVLIGSNSTFIFYLLCSAELIALSIISGSSPVDAVFPITAFFFLAIISWLSARSLEQALKDLRIINTNLDKLVDQKTQELALTLSRELIMAGRNQAILNSIADGVIVFDQNNTAILANPALGQLMETPIDNLMNRGITDFIENESISPATRDMLSDLLNSSRKSATGMRINWGNKTLSTSVASVNTPESGNMGTVAVFRDVTHEVELEKMKDTFMGIVSHELRTPLNAILGYAEMLREGVYGAINEKQMSITGRVMTNTERLLTIVTDLLDQAQIQSGKLKIQMVLCRPVELLDALHGVMDKIAADKGLEFVTELDPAMPSFMMGDPQRLQQIMVNLANNAVKFTNKGSVRVHLSRVDENNWSIKTIDTGDGIPKEAQEFIFETFRQVEGASTRQHGGVGLGLSIVKHLVELMRGRITVESELGKGSIFTAVLPLIVRDEVQKTIPITQE